MARDHDYMPHGTTWGIYLVLSIKKHLLLGGNTTTKLDSVLKSRHHFADKGLYSQSYGFSISHAWMLSWTIKKAECRRIDAFELLEKTLVSHLDCKEIQPVSPKEISPEYSLEGLMLKLKLQYSGHLMRRAVSFEKTLMLQNIEGRRRRGPQRMSWLDGITNSMDMSWVDSRSW